MSAPFVSSICSGAGFNKNHTAATTTANINTAKVQTPISVDVANIDVGQTAVITVNVPDNATGEVTLEIDGVKYTANITDGKARFEIDNLTSGNKTIAESEFIRKQNDHCVSNNIVQ